MRRAARTDDNHQRIAQALLDAGATVLHLHGVGMGAPDICAGFRGRNVLLEIKDGDKPKSARKLTPMQVRWHEIWKGQVAVVHSEAEAIAAIGLQVRGPHG